MLNNCSSMPGFQAQTYPPWLLSPFSGREDRFCSACGVDLDAQVLLEPTVATPWTDTSADEERRNLSMLFVPLGVVVAIALTFYPWHPEKLTHEHTPEEEKLLT